MPTPRINNAHECEPHFITLTILNWVNVFDMDECINIVLDSFLYLSEKKGLVILEYVVMSNHIHIIASAKEGSSGLSSLIRDFKRHTTKEILHLLSVESDKHLLNQLNKARKKQDGTIKQLWQRENYPELIFSEDFRETKVQYIWANPVRKGLVTGPVDWTYSSAKQRLIGMSSNLPFICQDWLV